jgi:hypothetical protein
MIIIGVDYHPSFQQIAFIDAAQERKPLLLEWGRKTREYREELADAPTQALPISWRSERPRTSLS